MNFDHFNPKFKVVVAPFAYDRKKCNIVIGNLTNCKSYKFTLQCPNY